MARIRSVHPSLFTDEAWVSCSPLARVLYIGLMTDADDQGLFEWKPLQIRMRLLPGDNADVAEMLAELVGANLIAPLESAGKKLGAIRYFRRFQRPKKPTAQFVLPAEWGTYVGLSEPSSEPDDDEGPPVPPKSEIAPQMEDGGWRVEGGTTEADASSLTPSAPKARRPSRRVPESWSPAETTIARLATEGHAAGDLERALTRMRDFEFKTARSDWDAAFRNWVRQDADRKPRHERPHHDAKFDARQANYASAWAGSERAAGRDREP